MSERTDELRRLLDERSIEWNYGMHGPSFSTEIGTAGNEVTFIEVERGLLCSTYLKPEQIADMFASFGPSKEGCGRETCHDTGDERVFSCSACGFGLRDVYLSDESYLYDDDGRLIEPWPLFCPNCGRKVCR